MPHVGGVDTDLVLAPGLQLELHERVLGGTCERMEMRHRILATIVDWRRIGDVGLIVFQPVGHRATILLHLSRHHCHIAAVVDDVVPLMLQALFGIHVLRIDHQSTGVAVESVHHMRAAALVSLLEIIVEHRLHVQRLVSGSHGEDAHSLFHDDEVLVFVDDFHIAALERVVAFRLAHRHLHSRLQGEVELRNLLAVDLDATSLERGLYLRAALSVECLEQILQQRCLTVDRIVVV